MREERKRRQKNSTPIRQKKIRISLKHNVIIIEFTTASSIHHYEIQIIKSNTGQRRSLSVYVSLSTMISSSLHIFLHLLPLFRVTFSWPAVPFRSFNRHYPNIWQSPTRETQDTRLFASKDEHGKETRGFSEELVRSLDLYPIFKAIAAHTGTKRGYQAIMSYVDVRDTTVLQTFSHNSPVSKRRRASGSDFAMLKPKQIDPSALPIAKSLQEAKKLYELTEEAILALTKDNEYNLTYPPIYGEDSGPFDTKSIPLTDYDEWLYFSSIEEWNLEHILEAEKVIETLIKVYRWADQVQTWMPQIASIGLQINSTALQPVWEEIRGSVKAVRVRSVTDPSGRNSYAFRINHEKYPVLGIMEDKLNEYNSGRASENKILDMTEEIEARENEIKDSLVRIICGQLRAIDEGMEKVGQLDVFFAKAAFSELTGGQIPSMESTGCIHVRQFVHPLLMQRTDHASTVVPIDLKMNDKKPILIVSGPNGGGKTICMKGFGVASVFSKTGIPIPLDHRSRERPRIDFFDEIHVSIGDGQDPENGQSTFTAQLAKYSNILASVLGENNGRISQLIIIDELGAGTEANAGGAIAQAVLEKLSKSSACRVVATTHSSRLKTLSFESEKYDCAAVLLKTNQEQGSLYRLPAFQLQYGLIGESYALGAASRCTPPLPMEVLQRAEELLTQESDSDLDALNYHVMTRSLQKQLQLAEQARVQAEKYSQDIEQIRRSMLVLASSYDEHFKRLEARLDSCYHELSKNQNASPVEIIGDTITQLRVVQKQIQSEKELLKERGIKLLPENYIPKNGEMVVIIQQGQFDGMEASVVASLDNEECQEEIHVLLSSDAEFNGELTPGVIDEPQPIAFKRHELGIWDYESIWEDESEDFRDTYSVSESRRRLTDILSRVRSTGQLPVVKSSGTSSTYNSSRERKAAKAKKTKGGNKRKK